MDDETNYIKELKRYNSAYYYNIECKVSED